MSLTSLHFPLKTHTGQNAELKDDKIVGTTYAGEVIEIALEDCVGLSVFFDHGVLKPSIEGQLTIVSKSKHKWSEFLPWFILIILHIFLGHTLWHLSGPLTCILTSLIFFHYSLRKNRVSPWFVVATVMAFAHIVSLTVFCVASLIACVVFVSQQDTVQGILKLRLNLPQRALMPYVFEYKQKDLQLLIDVRQSIVDSITYNRLISKVWLTNRYAEYLLTLFLPDVVYNHTGARNCLRIITDFLLPTFAIVQGLSILFPWIALRLRLLFALMKEDLLTLVFRDVVVPLFRFIFSSSVFKFLSHFCKWFVPYFQSIFAVVTRLFSFVEVYLLRIHYFIVYIGSQLPIRNTIALFRLLYDLGAKIVHFAVLKPLIMMWQMLGRLSSIIRFGKRTPEHILFMCRRISIIAKSIYDSLKLIRSTKPPPQKEISSSPKKD